MQEPETPVLPYLRVQAHTNHPGQDPAGGTDSTDEGWRRVCMGRIQPFTKTCLIGRRGGHWLRSGLAFDSVLWQTPTSVILLCLRGT